MCLPELNITYSSKNYLESCHYVINHFVLIKELELSKITSKVAAAKSAYNYSNTFI